MNKSSALLAALLAVSGAAFAADNATTTSSGDTVGAKARRGAHQVGESFKDMGRSARDVAHDLTHPNSPRRSTRGPNDNGYGGDTRTGARDSGSDMTGDAARRQRMDSAYANWQSKR